MPPRPRTGTTQPKPEPPMSKADTNKPPVNLHCDVLTISDTRDAGNDTSGDYMADSLRAAGHQDRTSDGEGMRLSVRGGYGGWWVIKKETQHEVDITNTLN